MAEVYQSLTEDESMTREEAFSEIINFFDLPSYVTYEYLENNL